MPNKKYTYQEALALAKKAGVMFPTVLAAQMGLETDWGTKMAYGKNNFFNIHWDEAAAKRLRAKGINVTKTRATVNDNGKEVYMMDFDSPEDAFKGLDMFYRTNSNYKNAIKSKTPYQFLKAIKKAKFAEDPDYVKKVWNIIPNEHKLDVYIRPAEWNDETKAKAQKAYDKYKTELDKLKENNSLSKEEYAAKKKELKDTFVHEAGGGYIANKQLDKVATEKHIENEKVINEKYYKGQKELDEQKSKLDKKYNDLTSELANLTPGSKEAIAKQKEIEGLHRAQDAVKIEQDRINGTAVAKYLKNSADNLRAKVDSRNEKINELQEKIDNKEFETPEELTKAKSNLKILLNLNKDELLKASKLNEYSKDYQTKVNSETALKSGKLWEEVSNLKNDDFFAKSVSLWDGLKTVGELTFNGIINTFGNISDHINPFDREKQSPEDRWKEFTDIYAKGLEKSNKDQREIYRDVHKEDFNLDKETEDFVANLKLDKDGKLDYSLLEPITDGVTNVSEITNEKVTDDYDPIAVKKAQEQAKKDKEEAERQKKIAEGKIKEVKELPDVEDRETVEGQDEKEIATREKLLEESKTHDDEEIETAKSTLSTIMGTPDVEEFKDPTLWDALSTDAISNLASAATGILGAKMATKDIPTKDKLEISNEFLAHVDKLKKISEMGLDPEEEASLKKDLNDGYAVMMENAVRASGGNRANVLGAIGQADANRVNGLLKINAQESAMKRDAMLKYGQALETIDKRRTESNRIIQNREYNQAMANKQAGGKLLGDSITKILDNINYQRNEKPLEDLMKKKWMHEMNIVSSQAERDQKLAYGEVSDMIDKDPKFAEYYNKQRAQGNIKTKDDSVNILSTYRDIQKRQKQENTSQDALNQAMNGNTPTIELDIDELMNAKDGYTN